MKKQQKGEKNSNNFLLYWKFNFGIKKSKMEWHFEAYFNSCFFKVIKYTEQKKVHWGHLSDKKKKVYMRGEVI